MTTAHRPTFTAAREHGNEHGVWGSGGVRSMMAHARDKPNHLKMKYRSGHQLEGFLDDDRASKIYKADKLEHEAVEKPLLSAEPTLAPEPKLLLTRATTTAAATTATTTATTTTTSSPSPSSSRRSRRSARRSA